MKNGKFTNKIPSLVSLIIPLAFLLLPVLGLISGAIYEHSGQGKILSLILPSGRRLDLLLRSLLLSLSTSAAALLLATAAALLLYMAALKHKRAADVLCYVSIFMFLLPSFIHSQGWWRVFETAGLPTSGFFPSLWVSVMFYLPLPLIVVFLSLRSADREALEAGTVFLKPSRVLFKVVLPSLYPALLGSFLLVFLLSLGDYSIASIFSVNTYSLDIFAQFSASGLVPQAFFYSIPLIIITLVAGSLGLWFLRGLSLNSKGEKGKNHARIELPKPVLLFSLLSLCIVLISISIPCLGLIGGLTEGPRALEKILSGFPELKNTVFISLGACLISLPLSLALGMQLNRSKFPVIICFLLMLPLIIPPSLIGIGLIGAFNPTFLYSTPAMPVLASAIRYTPLGAILCFSALRVLDRDIVSSGFVYQKSAPSGFFRLLLPMILPTALVSGLFVFILSSGEIGSTIMVLPPGFNTLSVKIYNYLHYGASNMVAALCSLLVGFTAAAAGLLYLGLRLFKGGRY